MIIAILLSFSFISFFIYALLFNNKIVSKKNQIQRSWSDLIAFIQKKNSIIPQLENHLKEYKDFESSTLKEMVELRTNMQKIDSSIKKEDLALFEKQYANAIKDLKISVENYPDLKSSSLYQKLMSEIVEQQNDITASIIIYNSNIEDFNVMIQTFPNSIFNFLFFNEKNEVFFNNESVDSFKEIGFKR